MLDGKVQVWVIGSGLINLDLFVQQILADGCAIRPAEFGEKTVADSSCGGADKGRTLCQATSASQEQGGHLGVSLMSTDLESVSLIPLRESRPQVFEGRKRLPY